MASNAAAHSSESIVLPLDVAPLPLSIVVLIVYALVGEVQIRTYTYCTRVHGLCFKGDRVMNMYESTLDWASDMDGLGYTLDENRRHKILRDHDVRFDAYQETEGMGFVKLYKWLGY